MPMRLPNGRALGKQEPNGELTGRLQGLSSDQLAFEHRDCLADEGDAGTVNAHLDHAASAGDLMAGQLSGPASPPRTGPGSSGPSRRRGLRRTPTRGAKNRETKSKPGDADRLVTMTPRTGKALTLPKSASGPGRPAHRQARPADRGGSVPAKTTGRDQAEVIRSSSPGLLTGSFDGLGREVELDPVVRARAESRPLRVSNRRRCRRRAGRSCQSTWAAASVAWPQRSTSTAGREPPQPDTAGRPRPDGGTPSPTGSSRRPRCCIQPSAAAPRAGRRPRGCRRRAGW